MYSDQEARTTITENIHENLFVEAGAGSGKTTSLVQRMVAMVKAGIDVSKICAITFTKAAALEFYGRFHDALTKESSENCRRALENIDLCFMGTIDSFCNMIISEHPVEAKVPYSASIRSDGEMRELYRQEYLNILRGEYGPGLSQKAYTFNKWHKSPQNVYLDCMIQVMERRNHQLIFSSGKKVEEETVKHFRMLMKALLENLQLLDQGTKDSQAAAEALVQNMNILLDEKNDNMELLLDALKEIRALRVAADADFSKLPYANEFLDAHYRGKNIKWYGFEDKAKDGYLFRFEFYESLREQQYYVTYDFICQAAPEIARRLRAGGNLSYFDYLLYLRDLLKEDAGKGGKLAGHIYKRHSYYLIDEFQDTNPLQAEVFFYITAKKADVQWERCMPHEGSLFIVGDPKQSIYRFRGADVSSFLKVRRLFEDGAGRVVNLTRNFRSTKELCTWFNEVFTEMMPEDAKDQAKFTPVPLDEIKEYDGFGGVFSYESDGKDDSYEVAEMIRTMVHNPSYLMDGREIDYGDIMVILPRKTKIGQMMMAFHERKIPFYVEGDVLFHRCPALKAAAAAFSAAVYPYDNGYTYLALKEGIDVTKEENRAILRSLSFERKGTALLKGILREFKILETHGSRNLEYLYFAMELLRSSDAFTLEEQSKLLEDLLSGAANQERCLSLLENEDRVHIANMHKVKGLQAPVVILAATGGGISMPPKQRCAEEKAWLFGAGEYSSVATSAFEEERNLEKDSEEAERIRSLYVAATRAEKALIIHTSGTKRELWKRFAPYCHMSLNAYLKDEADTWEEAETEALDAKKASEETVTVFAGQTSSEATYEILRPSQIKTKGRSQEASLEEREKDSNVDGAIRGTMVHALMEMLVSSGGWPGDDKALIRQLSDEYSMDSRILEDVLSRIRNGGYPQSNGLPADILGELLSAEEVHCELPVCYGKGSSIWHGIMDVVYCKDGVWHIVDYKTNSDGTALDERYEEQLKAYMAAFREMTGFEADAKTYHIEI